MKVHYACMNLSNNYEITYSLQSQNLANMRAPLSYIDIWTTDQINCIQFLGVETVNTRRISKNWIPVYIVAKNHDGSLYVFSFLLVHQKVICYFVDQKHTVLTKKKSLAILEIVRLARITISYRKHHNFCLLGEVEGKNVEGIQK